jgi:serine/threonine protein kinase
MVFVNIYYPNLSKLLSPITPEESGSGFVLKSEPDKPEESSGFVQNEPSLNEDLKELEKSEYLGGSGFTNFQNQSAGNLFNNSNKAGEKYTDITKTIFQGAMSDVYFARQDKIKKVIIKRLKKEFLHDEKRIELFFKEYTNGIKLDHPNLVVMNEKGSDENGPYIVMDYVDGTPLSILISSGINEKDITRISLELLDVIGYLHKSQVVHRDLKPDNILITTIGDNVKLIDLGLAYSDSMVDNIANAGTPKYMAPEMKTGQSEIDRRADIYSFGIILLEMFTRSTDRVKANEIKSEEWKVIISKCIENIKNDRYNYCSEIIKDIENIERLNSLKEIVINKSAFQNYQSEATLISPGTNFNPPPNMTKRDYGKISIQFFGASLPGDLLVDLFFNNRLIEKVSIKRGFNVSVDAANGNNKLFFQGTSFRKEFNILISDTSKNYKITLEYSRIAKNFTDSFYLQ